MAHNVRVCGADKKAVGGGLGTPALVNQLSLVLATVAPGGGKIRLFALQGYNSGPNQNIQLFDLAAMPANGVVPEINVPVPAGQYFYEEFGDGIPYFAGLQICNSTTDVTKTIGAANCLMVAIYRIEQ
jgi:hypothetical protein